MIRLILREPRCRKNAAPTFEAVREDTGEVVVRSGQPLYDGARALLEAGLPPGTLLTMRHVSSANDSWVPTRIDELAKWTVKESNRGGLTRRRWQPHPRSTPEGLAKPAGDAPGTRVSPEGGASRGPEQRAESTPPHPALLQKRSCAPLSSRHGELDERAPNGDGAALPHRGGL